MYAISVYAHKKACVKKKEKRRKAEKGGEKSIRSGGKIEKATR